MPVIVIESASALPTITLPLKVTSPLTVNEDNVPVTVTSVGLPVVIIVPSASASRCDANSLGRQVGI